MKLPWKIFCQEEVKVAVVAEEVEMLVLRLIHVDHFRAQSTLSF